VSSAESVAHTHIAAIVRDGRVIIPDETQKVRGGDRVVVFNSRRGVSDVASAFKAA
jgi:Trk K+ transport system NAD-binding subunit